MVDHDRQGVSGEKKSMVEDCCRRKIVGGGNVLAVYISDRTALAGRDGSC